MNPTPIKNEGWLYWLAFLIALGFRVIQLGALPLTDSEADLALQSLHLAQGRSPLLGPQPGYILLTSVLFAVIDGTNFLARFLPAIAGSALVFVPWFFRDRLSSLSALILAFLFAIDPGLVALSRQASGTMLAAAFLLFGWAMWRHGRLIPAGIFAGLALLSGPSLWAGLLVLGLTWLFIQGMGSKPAAEPASITDPRLPSYHVPFTYPQFRPAILSLLITLLLGGTLFFLSPNGLSAWLSALPAYLQGWTSPSSMTPGRTLLAFIMYEPLGIFLAVLSLIRGYQTRNSDTIRLGLWLGVALLLAVFYRQMSQFIWAIIPLLTLAALELARAFDIYREERLEVGVVVLALTILLVYIWFDLAKIGVDPHSQLGATTLPFFGRNIQVAAAPYLVLLGAFLILILCISFVAFGWSTRTAWLGGTWALVLFLGVYTLASAWGASGYRSRSGFELWRSEPPPIQSELLLSSVNDLSEFSLGHAYSQPVTIMGIDSPALEWVLRHRQVDVVSTLDSQVAPPIVITPMMNDLGLPSAYRGQDFTWRPSPHWEAVTSPDWIRWLVFRQLPQQNETIILWARDDLFPDARETSQP
ncbi:MAG TPA: hypothetical protein VK900_22400 [Anaerolineales bacterium]|nr:hypothetical protein [Anaerolineales bacterium]